MNKTKHMVLLALFIAMASVLHVVEGWLPLPLPVPGIKLGLANIVSLMVIVIFGWRDAIYVAIIRVCLASLFGGMFFGPAFAMSMSGAIVSTAAMAVVFQYHRGRFSLMGISVIGAAVHNSTQIIIAAVLVSSANLMWYLPYLILFALPTGLATGLTAMYFLAKAPQQL